MTISYSSLSNDKRALQILMGLASLWLLSTFTAYLHQLSMGQVCYLKLGILFGGGLVFWGALLPYISNSVIMLKQKRWTQHGKVAALVVVGILVVAFNQIAIHKLIGAILNFFFNCEDVPGSGLINPVQNNVLANSVIFGLISFVSWSLPARKSKSFMVRHGTRERRVWTKDILWIESDRNCITINTSSSKHVMYSSLKKFSENYLDETFSRVHRSIIVNKDYIDKIEKGKAGDGILRLSTGNSVRFSRNYKGNIQF